MSKSVYKEKTYKWVVAFVIIIAVCAAGSFLKSRYDNIIIIDGQRPVDEEELNTVIYDGLDDMVNVNTATAEELCSLPDVTPKIANNIIRFREALGGITNIADLRFVPGISETTYEELCVYVTIE